MYYCVVVKVYVRSGGFMCVHGDLAGSRRFLRAQEGSHAVHKFILGQRDT
ncbi:hypothetical protein EV282_2310 [Fictibacillus sp. BK138]|nr:hypothetical protein EV282_2310 [Fictibacillus sp. BK138]